MAISQKKIFLDERDGIREIKRRLTRTPAEEIVLVVPMSSPLGDSVERFHELRELGEEYAKEIVIESVDEHILELAFLAQLKAINPLFKAPERVVADIVPRSRSSASRGSVIDTRSKARKEEDEELPHRHKEISREGAKAGEKRSPLRFFDSWRSHLKTSRVPAVEETRPREKVPVSKKGPHRFSSWRTLGITGGVFALLFCGGVVLWWWLPVASVVLVLERTSVPVDVHVEVSTSTVAAGRRGDVLLVPGELFHVSRNAEQSFPAAQTRTIERKAQGTLRVFNAFSSSEQVLRETTRFQSPEGKIFRLDRRTVIPGASIEGGTIIPSSIAVSVTADEAGAAYNVGPSQGWSIPGFEGTPKFSGFYAVGELPMQGGFEGSEAAPQDAEIQNAESTMTRLLEEATRGELSFLPHDDELVMLDAAQTFSLRSISIVPDPDNPKQFRVFAEGERRELVFRKSDVESFIIAAARSGLPTGLDEDGVELRYESVVADLGAGTMEFQVRGAVDFTPRFDAGAFRERILGKNETELRALILGLPGIERARIGLWPFWVSRVPTNISRVQVEVE